MRLKKITTVFATAIVVLTLLLISRNHSLQQQLAPLLHYVVPLLKNSSSAEISEHKSTKIETFLTNRLGELEVPKTDISIIHLLEDSTISIKASVPRGKPMEWILWFLSSGVGRTGYMVADCYYQAEPFDCSILFKSTRRGQPTIRLTLTRSRRYFSQSARMAIVVHDFSFQADIATSGFFAFPEPLTLSLVSTRKMSGSSAEIAHEHNKELILLLPMEPLYKKYRQFQSSAIMMHYPAEKIRHLVDDASEKIPFYTGFSNLCGSRIMNDSRVLSIVFSQIKEKKSYFLFNTNGQRSTLVATAEKSEIPFGFIDISLDSATSAGATITDSLKHATMIAQKKGSVVFAAHATRQFQDALHTLLPYFNQNGVQLVPVSELVTHP